MIARLKKGFYMTERANVNRERERNRVENKIEFEKGM